MKLDDYKNDFYYFTGKLSDLSRQLAFAGLAVVWIFKYTSETNQIQIDRGLVLPAILLIASLTTDLLQYIYQSACWSIFFHYHEKRKAPNEEFLAPSWMNYFSWIAFVLKVIFLIIAYALVLNYLYDIFLDIDVEN
jgi:hypothetical protein